MLLNYIFHKNKYTKNTLVLLHGLMENINVWNNIYNYFSKTFNVLSIDFPGHGKSKFIYNDIIYMDDIAEMVKRILYKEKILKSFFLGHSMGGYVILSLLNKDPNLFSGLCLLNSTASNDTDIKKINRINSIKLIKYNYKKFIKESINTWFRSIDNKLYNNLKKFSEQIAIKTCPKTVISLLIGMLERKNFTNLLLNRYCPKLYISGKYDNILNISELLKESKKGINTKLEIIPSGHMGHLESTNQVINILENFIINEL